MGTQTLTIFPTEEVSWVGWDSDGCIGKDIILQWQQRIARKGEVLSTTHGGGRGGSFLDFNGHFFPKLVNDIPPKKNMALEYGNVVKLPNL